LDDATAYSLDVPLGLATVADIAHPQSGDLEQSREVIPQWFLEVPHVKGKRHPQPLCQSEIIYPNGVPEGLDPRSQEPEPLLQTLRNSQE
jgi:hypothetical protein